MHHTSKNGKFICNTTNIEQDGCPVHFGNHVSGQQVGFITEDIDFFFDTDGSQIEAKPSDIKELIDFVESVCEYLSTK